jgi:PTS system ascorbate-specific IIA component
VIAAMDLVRHLLDHDVIRLQAQAENWRDAVRQGVDLLVAAGTVEPRYGEAIIAMTEELGPWYVLAPGLAMPHARPEEGVLKDGFALLTLARPVAFGHEDNDPVDVLVMLAASSAKTMNEEAIVQVATLLDDEARVQKIRAARTRADIEAALTA